MGLFDDLLEEDELTQQPVQPQSQRRKGGLFDDLLEEEDLIQDTRPQVGQPAVSDEEEFSYFKPILEKEEIKPKAEEQGILRQVADIPLGIARGGVTGIKMMTDILGADNPVSKSLSGVEGYMADLMSAQAKEDQQEISRIMKDAEDKGFGEQVKAAIKSFSIAPVDIMSQALGTMAPVIATGLVGSAAKLGTLGVRGVQLGLGAAMGAGETKGEIYNEVKNELVNSGIAEDAAEKAAVEAQSYGGKNLDLILLNAGLGAASTLGAEGIITRILTKQGTAPAAGIVSRVLKGGLSEAGPEAGQEAGIQLSKNVALQREGFDVDPSRGVVAAATMGAIAGAPLGGIAGAVERPAPIKTLAEENLEQTNEIARKVAENGAPLTASAIQDQAAANLRQDELAKQLEAQLEEEFVAVKKPTAAPPPIQSKEEFAAIYSQVAPEELDAAEAGFTNTLATAATEEARANAQNALEAIKEVKATVTPPAPTITPAVTPAVPTAQPPTPDATQEIIQPEGVRQEPQDRVEVRPTEEAGVSDSILRAERGEEEGQVVPPAPAIPEAITRAIEERKPISAPFALQYGVDLPRGWRYEDDFFVPPAEPAPAAEVAAPVTPAPVEPAAIVEQEPVAPVTTPPVIEAVTPAAEQPAASIPASGKPFEFFSIRNKEKAPSLGTQFGQDVEPSGKYISQSTPDAAKNLDARFEKKTVRFENPLVVEFGGEYGTPTNWKNVLSSQYGGKTGKQLSQAIRDAGYDGIVTVEPAKGPNRPASTSEIVDISSLKPKKQIVAPTPAAPAEPAAEPSGISVGNRIKLGKSPQTYTIEEVIPQSATERELGEQYYSVKNERTGETQVVEARDLKQVKGKGARKIAAAPAKQLSSSLESEDFASAQAMVDQGAAMDRSTFLRSITPSATQRATTIHTRLEKDGIISKDEFSGGRGLVYGDGRGAASTYLGSQSYEPFPPSGFSPDYTGDRVSGEGDTINKKFNTILNTFVLNVVDPQTRAFIVKDIGNLLQNGGRAVFVTRGADVANSKALVSFGPLERIQRSEGKLTYQKGFTQPELIQYIKETLGEGFTVRALRGGDKSDVRVEVIKNTDITLDNPPLTSPDIRRQAIDTTPEGILITPPDQQYTFEEVFDVAYDMFGGEIPEGFTIVNDSKDKDFEFKAAYIPESGEIIVNLAYLNKSDDIRDTITHELGHYIFGDPEFRAAFDQFIASLSPEARADLDAYVETAYNKETGEIRLEEKMVRAFVDQFINEEQAPAWRSMLDAIKRFLNKLGFKFNISDRDAISVFTAALDRYKAGEAISREGGARKIIDDLTAMDAEYLAAVERGDMETAQRMVDEAAKKAGYNVGPVPHGTTSGPFNEFRTPAYFGSGASMYAQADSEIVSWKGKRDTVSSIKPEEIEDELDTATGPRGFDFDELYAGKANGRFVSFGGDGIYRFDGLNEYGDFKYTLIENLTPIRDDSFNIVDVVKAPPQTEFPRIIKAYLKLENPAILGASEGSRLAKGKNGNWDQALYDRLVAAGNDGAIADDDWGGPWNKHYIAFSPNQIKSADPVTYDDEGNVIPLSQRFRPTSPDIRRMAAEPAPKRRKEQVGGVEREETRYITTPKGILSMNTDVLREKFFDGTSVSPEKTTQAWGYISRLLDIKSGNANEFAGEINDTVDADLLAKREAAIAAGEQVDPEEDVSKRIGAAMFSVELMNYAGRLAEQGDTRMLKFMIRNVNSMPTDKYAGDISDAARALRTRLEYDVSGFSAYTTEQKAKVDRTAAVMFGTNKPSKEQSDAVKDAIDESEKTELGNAGEVAGEVEKVEKRTKRKITDKIEKVIGKGSLKGMIQAVKDTPLEKQQERGWIEKVVNDFLINAGLSPEAASTASKLYESLIAERFAAAKQKAFEDNLKKAAPWKNYAARNSRLAKDALNKVQAAIRTGVLDPEKNTESIIAAESGWSGFTKDQYQRIVQLDSIINDPKQDDVTRREAMADLNKVISDAKLPVRFKDALGAYYVGNALMGIPTLTVNIASPIGFTVRNLMTDVSKYAFTDPARIPVAFETFMESMRSWYDQTSYAFKNQIYLNDVVEYLQGQNVLRELFDKGKKQWSEGKYAEGFVNMAVGMTQITGRVLSSLDQGAISMLENQNITRYALEALANTKGKVPKDKLKEFANMVIDTRRKTIAENIANGMSRDRAGVLADLAVKSEVISALAQYDVNPMNVLDASINDALQSVGRNKTLTIKGIEQSQKNISDEGFMSYWPIKLLEMVSAGAGREGSSMQIFAKMLYGFALVPARVFHNVAWFSPYGFIRLGVDKYKKNKGEDSPYAMSLQTEAQYKQRLTEAIAGSVAMLGLAALSSASSDEDDEKKFKIVITGNGPNATTDKQYFDSWMKKWKPYSVHIVVNGNIIPINIGRGGEALFFPIMLAGALDDWKIKQKQNLTKKEPEDLSAIAQMLGSSFFALAQRGPYAAFTKPLFDASKDGRVTEELASQAGFFGKTFIPVLGSSLARNISDLFNDPVDRSSIEGAIYANTPVVGPWLGTKALNALGQPIRADDWGDRLFKLGVPVVFSFPKETPMNELNELILKQGSGPTIPTRANAQKRFGDILTDKEFETYVREYGRVMSDKIFKSRTKLANMKPADYDDELEKYARGYSIDGIKIKGASDSAVLAVKRMRQ